MAAGIACTTTLLQTCGCTEFAAVCVEFGGGKTAPMEFSIGTVESAWVAVVAASGKPEGT